MVRVDQKVPTICCLEETQFKYKDTFRLKVKRWRKIYCIKINQKKAEVAILFQAQMLKNKPESHQG